MEIRWGNTENGPCFAISSGEGWSLLDRANGPVIEVVSMRSKSEMNRSPGFPRAQHLPGTSHARVLVLVTLGVVLTLVVVPGVPVFTHSAAWAVDPVTVDPATVDPASGEPLATQDPLPQKPEPVVSTAEEKTDAAPSLERDSALSARIDRWIRDLAADSWRDRQIASESLIAAGEPVRAAVKHALTSDDPEVRAQAQSILTALSLKKQASSTAQDGTLEQKLRRTTSAGSVTIEVGGQPIDFERPRSPVPLPFPGGRDPFEGIRRAEQQMKRMEEQMFRRFPMVRSRNPLEIGALDPRWGAGPGRDWSSSSQVRITRNGQVILESHSSGGSTSIEPLGLTLEELPSSLRAHLPLLAGGGVIVSSVRDGSLAQAAGWQTHDILTAIDGTPIASLEVAQNQLFRLQDKNDLPIEIVRQGSPRVLAPIKSNESKPKRF
ncbi:MAG TPA: PDZ domain-containing protein [Planctomycetes bacterium]|nr:PDZ domain-containing protein [Planctomycetota bacterium]